MNRLLIPALLLFRPSLTEAATQSAFFPASMDAQQIHQTGAILFVGGGLIFLSVMLVLLLATFGPPPVRDALSRRAWIIGGGILFPAVVLTALLIYTTLSAGNMVRAGNDSHLRVEVTGELWWWRVRYLDRNGSTIAETANEIRIPVNQPVEFLLKSDNVLHSFWVPNLAGKLDMIPGHVNRMQIRADAPGTFRGQCAEYCGAQHAKMAFFVAAEEEPAFTAWLERQAAPAAAPADDFLKQGQRLFLQNRCGACHAIRGTEADGRLGPDLTHVGSRLSIAAGTLPGGQGSIAGWIAGTQNIKPGSKMPAYHQFSGEDLRALSAYLASLQ